MGGAQASVFSFKAPSNENPVSEQIVLEFVAYQTVSINFMQYSRGWTALQSEHLNIAKSGTNAQY